MISSGLNLKSLKTVWFVRVAKAYILVYSLAHSACLNLDASKMLLYIV